MKVNLIALIITANQDEARLLAMCNIPYSRERLSLSLFGVDPIARARLIARYRRNVSQTRESRCQVIYVGVVSHRPRTRETGFTAIRFHLRGNPRARTRVAQVALRQRACTNSRLSGTALLWISKNGPRNSRNEQSVRLGVRRRKVISKVHFHLLLVSLRLMTRILSWTRVKSCRKRAKIQEDCKNNWICAKKYMLN